MGLPSTKKMRDNRALIGERTINLRGVPYKLENYYPWLCKDEAEFFLLEKRKQQNNYKSKKRWCRYNKITFRTFYPQM